MINRFQNLLRIGGIVAASFILLAAGEIPQIVDAANTQ
jgi:hypothetical protein